MLEKKRQQQQQQHQEIQYELNRSLNQKYVQRNQMLKQQKIAHQNNQRLLQQQKEQKRKQRLIEVDKTVREDRNLIYKNILNSNQTTFQLQFKRRTFINLMYGIYQIKDLPSFETSQTEKYILTMNKQSIIQFVLNLTLRINRAYQNARVLLNRSIDSLEFILHDRQFIIAIQAQYNYQFRRKLLNGFFNIQDLPIMPDNHFYTEQDYKKIQQRVDRNLKQHQQRQIKYPVIQVYRSQWGD